MFQTDAAINQGNSSSPQNMARRTAVRGAHCLERVEGYLLTGELARVLKVTVTQAGLLLQRVARGSLAERFGLRAAICPRSSPERS